MGTGLRSPKGLAKAQAYLPPGSLLPEAMDELANYPNPTYI